MPEWPNETAVRNWTALRAGDRILIEQSSGQKQTGSVEEVYGTGNAIWVRHSTLNVRKLIHVTEVTAVKCHSDEVSPARLAAVQLTKAGNTYARKLRGLPQR